MIKYRITLTAIATLDLKVSLDGNNKKLYFKKKSPIFNKSEVFFSIK